LPNKFYGCTLYNSPIKCYVENKYIKNINLVHYIIDKFKNPFMCLSLLTRKYVTETTIKNRTIYGYFENAFCDIYSFLILSLYYNNLKLFDVLCNLANTVPLYHVDIVYHLDMPRKKLHDYRKRIHASFAKMIKNIVQSDEKNVYLNVRIYGLWNIFLTHVYTKIKNTSIYFEQQKFISELINAIPKTMLMQTTLEDFLYHHKDNFVLDKHTIFFVKSFNKHVFKLQLDEIPPIEDELLFIKHCSKMISHISNVSLAVSMNYSHISKYYREKLKYQLPADATTN